MKRVFNMLLIALLLTLSSSFLYGKEAKAQACGPGYYSQYVSGTTFTCAPINNMHSADANIGSEKSYLGYVAVSIAGLSVGIGVLMIVYAGYMYATSAGDPKRVQAAKSKILQAGIGIFIALSTFIFTGILSLVTGWTW